MSWEHHKQHVYGVRKVRWDKFWHVMYRVGVTDTNCGRETFDRVNRKTATRILRMIPKWSYAEA
jgi:hypothetical protein